VQLSNLGKTPLNLRLEQAERYGGDGTINAIRVSLPPKLLTVNAAHSGSWEWFSGKADELDTTLVRSVDLTGKTSAALSFWTWYDIEPNWDFGFVQVSTDGGATWVSLPIAGTTDMIDPSGMPSIAANLPGFTGNSGGWVNKTFDMSAYAGQNILLQFRYMTDWGTTMAGFFVDDISVTANDGPVFSDNVEALDPAWTADGWTRETGSSLKNQYYLMEWRNLNAMETPYDVASIVNFDNGLKNAYQFDPYGSTGNVNEPWWFSYNPGLLLWYRDMSYTDNWTGVHPGHGFLLVVDAHSQAMMRPPYLNTKLGGGALPWNSRVQTYDSTFSLKKAYAALLGYWGVVRNYAGLSAVPNFDDGHSYWDMKAPANSVITPNLGVLFRVVGQAQDGSAAVIGLGTK
jgi:immune inhibitor A